MLPGLCRWYEWSFPDPTAVEGDGVGVFIRNGTCGSQLQKGRSERGGLGCDNTDKRNALY